MKELRAPVRLALRRLRARLVSALLLAFAFGAAAALIGWGSIVAASSQDDSVRQALGQRHPSFQVLYYMQPLESDFRAREVNDDFAALARFTSPAHRIRITHSLDPTDPLGPRVVTAREPRSDVAVQDGRLPRTSGEVLVLRGAAHIGDRVTIGGVSARVVGTGTLAQGVLDDPSELSRETYLMRSYPPRLAHAVANAGSTVVTTGQLDPHKVDGGNLGTLTRALRDDGVRLERGDPLVRATAPFGLLHDLAHRGAVARNRLLLVAAEGAALILAFAAFLAATRRRETEELEEQLTVLGAARRQFWLVRIVEVGAPAFAAVIVVAAAVAAAGGLSIGMLLTLAGVTAAGIALLLATTGAGPSRRRFGVGPLELAAVTALALVAWQTATTGALDPARVADTGAAPVLLLVPSLAFFAVGVALLRILPAALRAGARASRSSSVPARLALLGAARNSGQAAAATTFLAVALGASLFSLDYRATLDRQARDQAAFTVGADGRVQGVRSGVHVLRLDGVIDEAQAPATVLALPARTLPRLNGWRAGFSHLSRDEIAARIRPHPVRLAGLPITGNELRVRARGRTDFPRRLVLHLLLHDQTFAHLTVGFIRHQWQVLRVHVPYRGAQIVAIAFQPTYVPLDFKYEPSGFIELGPLQEQVGGRWQSLPSLAHWVTSTAPTGTAGVLFGTASGIHYDLAGTRQPLIHPSFGLPPVRSGFVVGDLPAIVSPSFAGRAVDGLLVLDLEGIQIPVRVTGVARLFPTVVDRPSSFVIFDYDTLFAALNADEPGRDVPSETWFFGTPPPGVLSITQLRRQLERDPLARGLRSVLTVAGVLAALLGVAGIGLATRSGLRTERLQLAEYEALGVPPGALRRSAQLRVLALSAFGIVAGLCGALLSGRLIAGFVAVSGTARKPLPPILSVVSWPSVAVVLAAVGVATAVTAAFLTQRATRSAAGGRLRA